MKRTLVIHPQDKSTDFLIPIYSGIESATVIRGGVDKDEIKQLIEQHDRIIMLGHGSPEGLFAVGQFKQPYVFIINRNTVSYLRNKECIMIWCNAHIFCERHNLKGLYSGMFISEVGEANYCGIHTSQDIVNESNDTFALEMGEISNGSLEEIYNHIIHNYGILAEDNVVAKYNHSRLYLKS